MVFACRVLKVSTSGYYDWLVREESTRTKRKELLVVFIENIFNENYQIYGAPRITQELQKRGYKIAQSTVELWMRERGLRARTARRFRVVTTDSNHSHPVAENILNRDFNIEQTDVAWCSDISYIPTREGWLYLAVTLDICSRRVVGWSMGANMTVELVLDSLRMAINSGRSTQDCIHHSDRGSRYASRVFRQILEDHKMICSMSRKGNCWDNAVAESFFHTLKTEWVYYHDYETREEAKQSLFKYIEAYYNRKRSHSSIGYISPVSFEERINKAA